uniref:Putative acyltransferase n=1 Tax=termite gut metagenome TaxID=433724 RepID=S0DE35_9ZZZZ
MLFNTYIFVLLFLPLSLAGYYLLNRLNIQVAKAYLLGMSLWYYAYFNLSYLPIIVLSILINYGANRVIMKATSKRLRLAALVLALLINLGALFYYKYYDFFVSNINAVFGTGFLLKKLVIPLGISFFTFQQLSYVIDSYQGTVPDYNFLDYALFVTFFPQLIAGPIVTHDEIVPQFADTTKKRIIPENFSKGLMAFSFGLAKKVLLADTFGRVVTWGWGDIAALDSTNAILVMLAYTFQIYFDFSGYCDMASGIGLMFNIEIPMNFNSPYRSVTITEFWKRWHITLTRFFTRYVYIPLGGNRKGTARTYLNIFIVFLVSGIWHGANWTFWLWGALHGLFSLLTRAAKPVVSRIPRAIGWLITFIFVNITWIYFIAPSIGAANTVIRQIFAFNFGPVNPAVVEAFMLPEISALGRLLAGLGANLLGAAPWLPMAAFFAFGLFAVLFMKNTNERIDSFKPGAGISVASSLLLVASVFSLSEVSVFLYFNF